MVETSYNNNGAGSAFDKMVAQNNKASSSSCMPCGVSFNRNARESTPDLTELESFLAQNMSRLSLEERDKALEDLHAIGSVPEESPEALKQSLDSMSEYIDLIDGKKAYTIAKSMSSNYVTNEKRLLQFLRAGNYDPQKAAERLVQYFEKKLHLFGKDKLVKDIHLNDLTLSDIQALKAGSHILLDEKDRSGRFVIYTIGSIACELPLETRLRLIWYIFAIVSQDDEAQKKGVVVIYSLIGQEKSFLNRGPKVVELAQVQPVKITAAHCLYDNPLMKQVLTASVMVTPYFTLPRLRFHYGSHLEAFYKLMGYGIPRSILPVEDNGSPKTHLLEECIQRRVEIESELSIQYKTVFPRSSDILLGRGKKVQNYSGNVNFRNMLETNRPIYDSLSKVEKSFLIETILKNIKGTGGRFLSHGENGYHEVDDDIARKTISHAWRNLRSSSNKKQMSSMATICPMKRDIGRTSPSELFHEYSDFSDCLPQKRFKF